MRWSAHSSRTSLAVVVFLGLLLTALATLQYRWIAQLSEAERVRLQEGANQSAAGFCEDFDREIARAFSVFNLNQPMGDDELSELLTDRLRDWRSTAVWPELVKELTVIRVLESGEVALLCFDEASNALLQCEWDDRLLPIRRRMRDPGPGLPVTDGALPGLVLAIQEGRSPGGERPQEWRPPPDHLVVRFDLGAITKDIMPRLAESHFGADGGLAFFLRISSNDRPGEVIFQTTGQSPSRAAKPDATELLFGLRIFSDVSGRPQNGPPIRRPPPPGNGHEPRERSLRREPPPPFQPRARAEEGRWVLSVHHPAGSLETVVASARHRNMAISLATLVMLGVTAVLMVVSTRSARRLARQQMDFVAAVSHELRTPLTAIRSAGQNLADGIVREPEKVQNYGLLIEREGRRLTEMIGRVLTFAGIRSGRQIYRMEPVNVAEVVAAALEDAGWVLEETGFAVKTEIAQDLPLVKGDAAALRRVFTNLIDNAMKYAAEERWLGVRAGFKPTPGDGEIQVSISDHGPGIPKRELSTVFDPFRRGADAAGSSIPGSGLGLAVVRSIVEAHGGGIDVVAPQGGGATFTVRLPAASGSTAKRGVRK